MLEKQTHKKPKNEMSMFVIVKREFARDPGALFALAILAIALLFILIAPFFVDHEYMLTVNPRRLNNPPCSTHWLGTEGAGRDVFSLLAVGAGNSLAVALAVTLLSNFIGISLGLITGYFGGRFDNIMMRIVDFIATLPTLVMIIAILAIVPGFSLFRFIAVMTFFSWIGTVRLIRANSLQEKELEYIQASKTVGTPHLKIIIKELLPNISSLIIVNLTLSAAANVGIETGLTFLGFGFPFDHPSLGSLIASASTTVVMQHRWWIWMPAAIFVLVLMFSINAIGKTLERATDARLRRG